MLYTFLLEPMHIILLTTLFSPAFSLSFFIHRLKGRGAGDAEAITAVLAKRSNNTFHAVSSARKTLHSADITSCTMFLLSFIYLWYLLDLFLNFSRCLVILMNFWRKREENVVNRKSYWKLPCIGSGPKFRVAWKFSDRTHPLSSRHPGATARHLTAGAKL